MTRLKTSARTLPPTSLLTRATPLRGAPDNADSHTTPSDDITPPRTTHDARNLSRTTHPSPFARATTSAPAPLTAAERTRQSPPTSLVAREASSACTSASTARPRPLPTLVTHAISNHAQDDADARRPVATLSIPASRHHHRDPSACTGPGSRHDLPTTFAAPISLAVPRHEAPISQKTSLHPVRRTALRREILRGRSDLSPARGETISTGVPDERPGHASGALADERGADDAPRATGGPTAVDAGRGVLMARAQAQAPPGPPTWSLERPGAAMRRARAMRGHRRREAPQCRRPSRRPPTRPSPPPARHPVPPSPRAAGRRKQSGPPDGRPVFQIFSKASGSQPADQSSPTSCPRRPRPPRPPRPPPS